MKAFLVVFVLFTFSLLLQGQNKFEKETRVKEKYVPEKARDFVHQLELGTRVKWYLETGINSVSYEAKTKRNKRLYSIEFDDYGSFEDIEIVIDSSEVPEEVYRNIIQLFDSAYQKHKITRMQFQYSGDERLVIESVKNNTTINGITIRYEVVVSVKTEGKFQLIEYLFSDNGSFLKRAEIVMYNTDNIEF